MTRIFGLKACDTCRKARKALAVDSLHDVRETPLSATEIARFAEAFGDALVNRKSTTWRALSEAERALPIADLIAAHPTVMKRPVIESAAGLTLGWSDAIRNQHLGTGSASE